MTTSERMIQGIACVTAADETHQIIFHAQAFGMGKELKILGDDYEGVKGFYTRFRGELEICRNSSMQSECMRNPVKEKGRQVLFLNEGQEKITCLDLMKQKVDSPEGHRMYSRRMWTIEPVFGNIISNRG
jgi:hypothetical protein